MGLRFWIQRRGIAMSPASLLNPLAMIRRNTYQM
jgi:hypothetical protein